MRILVGVGALLLASSTTAWAADEQDDILELRQQLQMLESKLEALEGDRGDASVAQEPAADAGLEARLDEIIRQSPTNPLALSAPKFTATPLDGITWDGDFRFRAASYQNLPTATGNSDSLTFDQALQLGFGGRLNEKTRLYAEFRDARVFGADPPFAAVGTADTNLAMTQAFLELTDIYDTGVDLRIGRQRIVHGAERQFGENDWLLQLQRFDGITAETVVGESTNVFLHALRLADGDSAFNNEFSPGAGGANSELYTLYVSHDASDTIGTIDGYFIYLDADPSSAGGTFDTGFGGRLGRSRISTVGARIAGDQAGLFYDVEAAKQFGTINGTHVDANLNDAWMLATRGGFQMDEGPFRRAYAGYDYVKGGVDGYVQLFPDAHGTFGILDVTSWTNIEHFVLGVDLSPLDGEDVLTIAYHWLRLEDGNSAFFGQGPFPGGNPGGATELGQEADLIYKTPCSGNSEVELGVGVFFPGDAYTNAFGTTKESFLGFMRWGIGF